MSIFSRVFGYDSLLEDMEEFEAETTAKMGKINEHISATSEALGGMLAYCSQLTHDEMPKECPECGAVTATHEEPSCAIDWVVCECTSCKWEKREFY